MFARTQVAVQGRRYTFDSVIGAEAGGRGRAHMCEAYIRPLVRNVCAGINCAVFAYGQTSRCVCVRVRVCACVLTPPARASHAPLLAGAASETHERNPYHLPQPAPPPAAAAVARPTPWALGRSSWRSWQGLAA